MMWRLVGCVMVLMAVRVSGVVAQDIPDILEAVVAEFSDNDGPPLVVQVVTADGSWAVTGGLADGVRPTEADDRFRIASMSKTYLGVLALMLVEDGLLDLDEPASNWLPMEIVDRIPNAEIATVRQLLSMRSGIEDYLDEEFFDAILDDPSRVWTAPEVLTFAYDLEPVGEPDELFYYSNTNYVLAQLVLEQVSGKPLHTLMRERIIEPLSLSNTYTQVTESLPGGFVNGYEDVDGDGTVDDVTDVNDGAGLGDGGLVSTTADIVVFYKALLQEQTLLSEASMAELLRFQDDDEGGGYSLGLTQWETEVGTAWGHAGGVIGFASLGVYLPEEEIIVVVLSGDSDFSVDELVLTLVGAVLD